MSTTVHIPAELLERVDARASALGLSRNRLIVHALKREVERGEEWSPEFLEELSTFSSSTEIVRAVDAMLDEILARRSSRKETPL